jgi:hypothetical protein
MDCPRVKVVRCTGAVFANADAEQIRAALKFIKFLEVELASSFGNIPVLTVQL